MPGTGTLLKHLATATAVVAITLVVIASLNIDVARVKPDPASLKQPPAEYVYLDTPRVLSYLGELEGGLTSDIREKTGINAETSAALSPSTVASLSRKVQQQLASEQTVTPTVASRYYALERLLRLDRGGDNTLSHGKNWLSDLDMAVTSRGEADFVRFLMKKVPTGYFVRLRHAHLCVPTFVGVLRRFHDLPTCGLGSHGLGPPATHARRRALRTALKGYRHRFGKRPTVPLIVQTLNHGKPVGEVVSFLMHADYHTLTSDPSLLTGNVTVVSKVMSMNAVAPGARKASYIDRDSFVQFTRALRRAPPALRRAADLGGRDWRGKVREALRIKAPLAVLLPVAIYK